MYIYIYIYITKGSLFREGSDAPGDLDRPRAWFRGLPPDSFLAPDPSPTVIYLRPSLIFMLVFMIVTMIVV